MNMDKYRIQTDLAIETKEMVSSEKDVEIEGVKVVIEEKESKNIKVTRVNIFNEAGSKSMGKPIGNYITIESDLIKENESDMHRKISKIISGELKQLFDMKKDKKVFVAGLGNWNVTADSLGPKVVSKTIVTRHLYEYMKDEISKTFGCVSAFVPGVMGITGMETSELVKSIVERTSPDLLIVVDSLAARNVGRLNTTIQITDTGIHPGSGVGNARKEINKDTVGVPVIAIGVPTVVNAVTLVSDVVDNVNKVLNDSSKLSIPEEEKHKIINELLLTDFQKLCVTPKEEDMVIKRLRNIISDSINIYAHHGVDIEDVREYL